MHTVPRRSSFLFRLGSFVRFSHTIFALPFALISMLVAGNGRIEPIIFAWILLCMVGARTAAMCFNRLMDWEIDKQNPRTKERHTLISKPQGWCIAILSCMLAITAAHQLNPLCFRLSPLMIAIIFFYSLTKRFTSFSHLFLGMALGVAPLGAWAAVRGSLFNDPQPFVLATAVGLWTFGFDLIYATLDADFDKTQGLFSYPSRYGIPASLRLAKALHLAASLGFAAFGILCQLGAFYWASVFATALALIWEHRLAASEDPKRINQAFFQVNAIVSICLLAGVCGHFHIWTLLF